MNKTLKHYLTFGLTFFVGAAICEFLGLKTFVAGAIVAVAADEVARVLSPLGGE